MTGTSESSKPTWSERWFAYRNTKLADSAFQRWASVFPLTRVIAARRARALFDISAGFVHAQVLLACVRLHLFEALASGPATPETLAADLAMPLAGMRTLLDAAAGLKLVERRPGGLYGLGVHGAAYLGNPAIEAMIEHNALLYRDLEDPLALLRGHKNETALSRFWPYAGAGAPAAATAEEVAAYSTLMSQSQSLVADDVLDAYPLPDHGTLLDVGGGEGLFLIAAGRRHPALDLVLFDLPAVVERATAKLAKARLAKPVRLVGGDFSSDALPAGADMASLVRVLHDHDDAAALALLAKVFDALKPGGILLLAEPFAAAKGAESVGTYFDFYLLAMRSGRPRSAEALQTLLYRAGFARARPIATPRPILTGLIVAQKSAGPANRM